MDLAERPCLLLATPDFPPAVGGIQILVHRLAMNLPHFHTRVVTLAGPGSESFDRESALDIRRSPRVGRSQVLAMAALNANVVREAWRYKPQLAISGHIVSAPATALIGRLLQIPTILYLHADEVAERPHLARFATQAADAVIAVSRHTAALAVRVGASPARVHRIPPGVDVPDSSERRTDPDQPTLVTVARITERYKGHDLVIDALPSIAEKVPRVKWVVIGDGPLRPELERRAAARGVAPHIHFAGSVSDREKEEWLSRADVFVLPSRMPESGGGEGFGIVFLEAGARGVPVVGGNEAGVTDAVVHDETGLLVDPRDPAALASAITELLLDPVRARALGAMGRARAEQFAWPLVAAKVEKLALDLVRDRAR